MLLGHWRTTPSQNFVDVHLNRVIKKFDLDMIYVSGPGHGGPAVVGNTYLEGYLLTGRHGLFNCYEAFIHIVDSMFNQHAKWLKVTSQLPWRRKIASLKYLLASHVWRRDHNGFTHQDPGFIDHVVNKQAEVVRVYLPPDANCNDRDSATTSTSAATGRKALHALLTLRC